jgi:hypothetical protein
MADNADSSINTIVYRLNQITTTLEQLTERVDTKYVRFDLFETYKQLDATERLQITSRIDKLEQRSEWLIRTIGGFIITAVLGLVVVGTKALIGGG